ncbi:ATP-binding cassette domain-containing protein [Erysipelothrix sp. HDW6C]|uniref:ABC transporter ATP-binding protein n=1 Tax=Erysipelothrix sp. HDW6C TaxID=2714930 RepID=UPI00140DFB3A|nr:ATP-binding cassette domain-containing protein [Erysipelothrix sp. HDW6C]QIK70596.1 ATP-binding cassette domain-containing protein [Erysipelothrix sp. HDW6C]
MDNIIQVRNLSKHYTKKNGEVFEAVRGIDFDVRRGEIFSFLGPNGAGKSTTINMLTTQKIPTSGTITIDGKSLLDDPIFARSKIGVVAQHNNLDRGLTARENLIFHAQYFGMNLADANRKADELLERFGLLEWQHEYVKSFSGGMAQRLKIARAIVHDPDVLFLDEPTTGLDPAYRNILWEQMIALNKKGTTVFLTTHYMEEPEQFSDRIAIFSNGVIQAIGTTEELKKLTPSKNIITIALETLEDYTLNQAKKQHGVNDVVRHNETTMILYMDDLENTSTILNWVNTLEITIKNFSVSSATLDDVFVHLTTKGAK